MANSPKKEGLWGYGVKPAKLQKGDTRLTADFTLDQFSGKIDKARLGFAVFVAAGMTEGHRPEFHGQGMTDSRCIGADFFVERALEKAGVNQSRTVSVQELVAAVCDCYGIEETGIRAGGRLSAEARGVAAYFALKVPGCSLVSLVALTGRDASTLSSAARRVAARAVAEEGLARKIGALKDNIAVLQA